ncbi:MAG: RES family NAD+ phosphorylase [Saprospiraceae bacterium]|nr:RES family NAD+ phosphorylase [Saprospiraceae bacterium]
MFAYRVEKKKYLATILDGIPGEKSDFRWNTKGNPIIYASATRSLALHEKSGNMSKPFHGLHPSFMMVEIELPDGYYNKVQPENLPFGWDDLGAYHPETQKIGNKFIASDQLALYVPSTIVKGEFNVLINPRRVKDYDIKMNVEEINERLQDLR